MQHLIPGEVLFGDRVMVGLVALRTRLATTGLARRLSRLSRLSRLRASLVLEAGGNRLR